MKTIKSIIRMQKIALDFKRKMKKIAFVPTMGALHEGHLALVRKARKLGDIVVVSIFVNPTQFGPSEDLAKYPKSLNQDKKLLKAEGVDYLFLPENGSIYPLNFETYVFPEKSSLVLEGEFRPIHFRGVATVVTKLFNIVQPDLAVFGRKDFQQSVIIKKLVRDLNIPTKIVVVPTVREKSGLAMSSRNRYFNAEQKERATVLYKSLKAAREKILMGERSTVKILKLMRTMIEKTEGTRIDYIAITDDVNLEPLSKLRGKFTISLAVWLDDVRLIDNISVSLRD